MSTTPSYPESNLIKSADLARVREIDFALMFNESIKKLVEALGITRKQKKAAGTVLKTYKATGTLESGAVAEGDLIPLSKYTTQAINWGEITLNKWRKATSIEAIIDKGFDQAVTMTDERMIKDVQKGIRSNFFNFLAEGTTATGGSTLQAALAKAWGQLQVLFEDDEISAVYFVNPLDIADYLASASITVQTAFGMSYVENFLGLGTVFMNSSVPSGTVYATAKDNIILYYVSASDSDIQQGFSFTTDETGYIGIHENSNYDNLTNESIVISGIALLAERLDGIVVSLIDATPSLGALTVTSSAGTNVGDTALSVSPSLTSGNSYVYKVGTAAVEVKYGQVCKTSASGWTAWDGSADITAATGKVLTLVEIDSNKRAQLAGSATVTAKAAG